MSSKLCTVPGCERLGFIKSTGECQTHRLQKIRGYKPLGMDKSPHPRCSISHCELSALSRTTGSLCGVHYRVKYRGRDPQSVSTSGVEDPLCWFEECMKPEVARGLCKNHYEQARQGRIEVPDSLGVVLNPFCSFEGCPNRAKSVGLCTAHRRQKSAGKELTPLEKPPVYAYGTVECLVKFCRESAKAKGMCSRHRHGFRYGMTPDEIVALFENPVCGNLSCDETEDLYIDHCHKTDQVRGLLCHRCNLALGFLKDDPLLIEGLKQFMLKWE